MMPKMSVRPLATRNSVSPYCTLFNTWMRNICKSILHPTEFRRVDRRASAEANAARRYATLREAVRYASRDVRSAHRAAASRIGERLRREADRVVLAVFDLAQIEILHDIVRGGQRDLAAGAVDFRGGHRLDELRALGDVAVYGFHPDREELRRVVALHRVHVGLAVVGLGVGEAERGIARSLQVVGVMQRREQPVGRRALRLERAIGEESRSEERNLVLEPRRGVVLDELDRAAAGEERVDALRFER